MTALSRVTDVYARQRPRLVAAALRHPRLAAKALAVRNTALAAAGRPEHAQRLAAAVRASAAISGSDLLGSRAWPRGPLRWVILDGLPGSASSQYRVLALRRALARLGHAVEIITPDELNQRAHRILQADVFVLFRVTSGDTLERICDAARGLGVVLAYDIDDLVFDQTVANEKYVDGLRFLTSAEKRLYEQGVRGYAEALDMCDVVCVPTEALAQRVRMRGKPAFVVPNSLTGPWEEATPQDREAGAAVVLGYASGTRTHQADFKAAASALPALLDAHPNAVLRVVGHLDLSEFPELAARAHRVELLPPVPFDHMPDVIGSFDVNLAPLELGNPYCEGKSQLKYFEAAQVGVPTVASPTNAFASSIAHGETGFLADTPQAWFDVLDRLVREPALRQRVGAAARTAVQDAFSASAHERSVDRWVAWLRDRQPAAGQVITMLLPGIDAGSGGVGKAIDLFKSLAGPGRHLQLVVQARTASFSDPHSVDDAYHLTESGISVLMVDDFVPASDITLTTYFTTALRVAEADEVAGDVVQLLQDYEPLFFPMSERYLAAKHALDLPHRQITYGPWVAAMLEEHHGRSDAAVIPYYIDHSLYGPCCDAPRCRHAPSCSEDQVEIVVLARPEMARRCYPMVAAALEEVHRQLGDKVTFLLFGSNEIKHFPPACPHEDLGLRRPSELARLYRRADLGVAVSPTNPSMVPFEMMACGLPVVDVDVPHQAKNYGRADNVILAPAHARGLADTIVRAVEDRTLREETSARGAAWARSLPTRDDVRELFAKAVFS